MSAPFDSRNKHRTIYEATGLCAGLASSPHAPNLWTWDIWDLPAESHLQKDYTSIGFLWWVSKDICLGSPEWNSQCQCLELSFYQPWMWCHQVACTRANNLSKNTGIVQIALIVANSGQIKDPINSTHQDWVLYLVWAGTALKAGDF